MVKPVESEDILSMARSVREGLINTPKIVDVPNKTTYRIPEGSKYVNVDYDEYAEQLSSIDTNIMYIKK